MGALAFGVLVGAIVALAVCAPLFASWPTRLRCLLVAQTMDPFGGLPLGWGTVMCEVTVVEVNLKRDWVEVTLAEGWGGSQTRQRRLIVHSTAPGLVANLEGWCAVRLPLLLTCDERGEAQLAGPGATLTGFREPMQQEHRGTKNL